MRSRRRGRDARAGPAGRSPTAVSGIKSCRSNPRGKTATGCGWRPKSRQSQLRGSFRVYGSGGSGVLARLLAADQDRHAAQIDEDLRRRCAVVFAVIVAPNISISRCFRVVADDMKVIEFEFRIGHHLPSRGERISDNTSGQLRCDTESATQYVQIRMRNILL